MTKNNEQIINTTKCKHNTFDGGNTQREICLIDNKYCDGIRTDDCYFKQLKYLEKAFDYREKTYLTNLNNLADEAKFLREKLHSKEQECEELKETIRRRKQTWS